jgi:hypothetical protein
VGILWKVLLRAQIASVSARMFYVYGVAVEKDCDTGRGIERLEVAEAAAEFSVVPVSAKKLRPVEVEPAVICAPRKPYRLAKARSSACDTK